MSEYCFKIVRVRPNRTEEAEVALNQEGSRGFHVVGIKEYANDFVVVMEKELVPVPMKSPPIKIEPDAAAPVAKRGPGRPKKG